MGGDHRVDRGGQIGRQRRGARAQLAERFSSAHQLGEQGLGRGGGDGGLVDRGEQLTELFGVDAVDRVFSERTR